MAQWKIKELSKATKVSVRMLHHYDKIGLLNPAMRASNSYRLYNEQNLATLQQIIALKFFGFSLRQIKTMLQQKMNIKEHLLVQQRMLKKQTEHLKQAHDALNSILQQFTTSDTLAWNDLITLIERYRMAAEAKKTWNRHFENLKQEYPKEVSAWEKTVQEINSMQLGNPEGADGKRVAKVFLNFMKAQLAWEKSQKIFNKLSNEEILHIAQVVRGEDTPLKLTSEGDIWFAQALGNYFLNRWKTLYQDIDKNIDTNPEGAMGKKIVQAWRELIDEQIMGMPPEATLGIRLWQETSDSQSQLKEQCSPAAQKKQFVPLYTNPLALIWIKRALESH